LRYHLSQQHAGARIVDEAAARESEVAIDIAFGLNVGPGSRRGGDTRAPCMAEIAVDKVIAVPADDADSCRR